MYRVVLQELVQLSHSNIIIEVSGATTNQFFFGHCHGTATFFCFRTSHILEAGSELVVGPSARCGKTSELTFGEKCQQLAALPAGSVLIHMGELLILGMVINPYQSINVKPGLKNPYSSLLNWEGTYKWYHIK